MNRPVTNLYYWPFNISLIGWLIKLCTWCVCQFFLGGGGGIGVGIGDVLVGDVLVGQKVLSGVTSEV